MFRAAKGLAMSNLSLLSPSMSPARSASSPIAHCLQQLRLRFSMQNLHLSASSASMTEWKDKAMRLSVRLAKANAELAARPATTRDAPKAPTAAATLSPSVLKRIRARDQQLHTRIMQEMHGGGQLLQHDEAVRAGTEAAMLESPNAHMGREHLHGAGLGCASEPCAGPGGVDKLDGATGQSDRRVGELEKGDDDLNGDEDRDWGASEDDSEVVGVAASRVMRLLAEEVLRLHQLLDNSETIRAKIAQRLASMLQVEHRGFCQT
eukprot:1097169-Pleurochrysis_carterae.AAC.3